MHPPAESGTRGIAVLDVGATNSKAVLFDAGLSVLAEQSIPAQRRPAPPYLSIDPRPLVDFMDRVLPEFDACLPVDVVVPCAHGSAAALLDPDGQLALPIMSYEAQPPADIIESYAAVAPPFAEVFAPTNPLALTLARQLHWQQAYYPEHFAKVQLIVPLAQYVAFLLCGSPASEVSAWGAQTHLWAPLAGDFSTLAKRRGWATRFAPLRQAWEPLGRVLSPELRGRAAVLTGVHDSNANLLRYLDGDGLTLLSTGTWIIGFVQGIDIRQLDAGSDQVANTTVFGDAIASCRFMGGREFELVADGAPAAAASRDTVCRLLDRSVSAWPSFTTSGGPAPGTGGRGHIDGTLGNADERASLASLYCAQMSALMLRQIGGTSRVIVDGPFSDNPVYLEVLAACLPDRPVYAAAGGNGTAAGAASLALLADRSESTPTAPPLQRITAPPGLVGHRALARWFEVVDEYCD